jgi:hypothetical protein
VFMSADTFDLMNSGEISTGIEPSEQLNEEEQVEPAKKKRK